MSLGLPSHLAARTITQAFARSLHAIGLTLLVSAFLSALVFQAARPHTILWPAMIAIVPMVVLLLVNRREPTFFSSASYLLVGAACTYWYILTFYAQAEPILAGDAFSIALPKIALVMVGGVGVGLLRALAWALCGYAVAEAAAAAAILQSGEAWRFDIATAASLVVTVVILVLWFTTIRRFNRAQPLLHRAVQDEQLALARYRIEARAAALMHDTVLSHLAAIANAPDAPIDAQLSAQIHRDLEIVVGEEWLADHAIAAEDINRNWRQAPIFAAIEEMRELGLEVSQTGDLSAVLRLDDERAEALAGAVKQCLVNVLDHSGTTRAEVVAYIADQDISVMIIDSGVGFSEDETRVDRLGLRNSVRQRVQLVGGAVHVWSTPGQGTSIMIRMPIAAPAQFALGEASP
jgi:signal transduction histidine kinase